MRMFVLNFKEERPLLFNFILLLLVALTGGLVWSILTPSSQGIALPEESYNAFATDIHAIKFSENGSKQYELSSPRLNHYDTDDQTRVETPKLYLYTPQHEAWLITAQHALLTQGMSVVEFIDQVDLTGEHTLNHQNTQLLTEKVSYYPDKNVANTTLPVTIIQPGTIIHATGMEVAFNTGTISLLSKINGSYDPNVHS